MEDTAKHKICTNDRCGEYLLAIKDSIELLHGKWKAPIIVSLIFGSKRFNELQREIKYITPKMLSRELRDLEMNQLVKRTVYDSIPATVEYSLTAYGRTLRKVIEALREWGMDHRRKMIRKRVN
jgi:DNA-binding HxlR family transcriptional regulator